MRLATLAIAAIAFVTPSLAQDYPTRPVTFVVGFPPGSASDTVARNLGARLAEKLGKPFVIENKPGAGSIIAAQTVARAAPDGHTIFIAPIGTLAINKTLYKSLPYDPLKDFAMVAHIANFPYILVVSASSPIKSVPDLIKAAKDGKKFTFASSGAGTGIHLTGELFKRMAGIDMQHVPYRGPALAVTDIIAGHVDMIFSDPATVVQLVKEGKLRALGVSSKERFSVLPDVPTIAEGLPGFESRAWHVIVAPAGTPEPILTKLRSEFRTLATLPEVKQQLLIQGLVAVESEDTDGIRKMVETDAAMWDKFLREVGLAGSE